MRLRARTENVARVMGTLNRLSDEMDREEREAIRQLGREGQQILRSHAPSESGRLEEGIRFRTTEKQVSFSVRALDPDTGYNYAAVTRFGHRLEFIEPVAGKALMLPEPGRPFSARVPGYKPESDWVDGAFAEFVALVESRAEQISQRLELVART